MVFVKPITRTHGRIFSTMNEFELEVAAEPSTDAIASTKTVEDYLVSWGLAQYVDKFKEHYIDLEALQLLTADDIKELVPVIGHRAKLVSQIAMVKNIITDAYPSSFSKTIDNEILNVDSNTISINLFDNSGTDLVFEEPLTSENLQQPKENCELYKVLSSCNEGKGLLLQYQESGLLDNASRRRLCNIIINNELKDDPDKKIASSRFYQLSYEITSVFKKESASVYFIPFTKFSPNQKISAKGKLLDCFRQRRRDFIKSGVVKSKERRSSSVFSNESESPYPSTSSRVQTEALMQLQNDDNDTSDKLLWLKNCCDPWETVENYWTLTTKSRFSLLQSKNTTIQQYYSDFKPLTQPGGIYLLLKDYQALYPSHEHKFTENWHMIRPKILEFGKKKNILKEILSDLEHTNDEILDLAAFLSIPFLMTTSNVTCKPKNKARRIWRPSKQEVAEGFIAKLHQKLKKLFNDV